MLNKAPFFTLLDSSKTFAEVFGLVIFASDCLCSGLVNETVFLTLFYPSMAVVDVTGLVVLLCKFKTGLLRQLQYKGFNNGSSFFFTAAFFSAVSTAASFF